MSTSQTTNVPVGSRTYTHALAHNKRTTNTHTRAYFFNLSLEHAGANIFDKTIGYQYFLKMKYLLAQFGRLRMQGIVKEKRLS